MIDRVQIMFEILTAASPLATEIGTQAYFGQAPEVGFDATLSTIVFNQIGAGSHLTGATNTAIFDFKCYSKDNKQSSAESLFRLLYDRLQNLRERVPAGKMMLAELDSDFPLPIEPETKYKAHMAQFSILFEG